MKLAPDVTELIIDAGRVNCPLRAGDVPVDTCLDCARFRGLARWSAGTAPVLRCTASPRLPLAAAHRP